MDSSDLRNLQEAYLDVYEATGRDEMLAANLAKARTPKPTTGGTVRTPGGPVSTPGGPVKTPTPGPVAQAPKPSGGVLGKVDSTLRDVAGRVGGEIGARRGREKMGNLPVLGDIGGAVGRNRGTQQGQQMYDKAKGALGGLLKQDYEPDMFDIILEYLVTEGYADTNENALVIMANMSEEWRESIVEFSQTELNSVSSSINQATRNASIRKQQPGFQSSQSEPQRPTGVPIPGTRRVFNTVKKVGQSVVGSALK